MCSEKIKNIVPKKGIKYALYVDRVEFNLYNDVNPNELEEDDNLLELHLFDKNIEYRYIKARNKAIRCLIVDVDYYLANSANYEDSGELNICIDATKTTNQTFDTNLKIYRESYEETVYVQEGLNKKPKLEDNQDSSKKVPETVDVINYIEYEDDLLKFVNYRLKMNDKGGQKV